MLKIIEVKKALDVIKPMLNAAQVGSLNEMMIMAVTSHHEGLVDEAINADLSVLNIVRSEHIFEDSPF